MKQEVKANDAGGQGEEKTRLDEAVSPLTIRLFGDFAVSAHGVAFPKFRSRRDGWLLALLILQQERPCARTWLAQTLWPFPDHAVDQAAYNLRRSLSQLRKALGDEAGRIVSPTPGTVKFSIDNAEVDVLAFDRLVGRDDAASLERAVSLYAGPLLLDCTETWASGEREKRAQQYLDALKRLAARAVTGGDYEAAIGWLRRAVAANPDSETLHETLMETLAQSGDVNAALATYQTFSLRLHETRNAHPGEALTELYHRLRNQLREGMEGNRGEEGKTRRREDGHNPEAASLYSLNPVPCTPNVPVPLTTLIGREAELREIETRFRLLRLMTLTGAGGVGKTRLAIQLAENLAAEFRDGVGFVDFDALTAPGEVAQTVAAALDVPEEPGRPLGQSLVAALRTRQFLLVLDNCEHLAEPVARLAEGLLPSCRGLRILATSRQPLEVGGEGVWRVTSLALPDLNALPADPDALIATSAAVQLFVERARQAQPDFRLTTENASAVALICSRLDGIPLAIELAAARVRVLPVEQIAQRLDDRFGLLTGGTRAGLSRQQTLEATVKWSFDLLGDTDRGLLCALTVFAGGWTLEAAEFMGEAASVEARDVLDALTRLVDRSLVIYESEGREARYRMLESVRQYGRERLTESGHLSEALSRHLDYFLGQVETAKPFLHGPRSTEWLNRLEREQDNLRVALDVGASVPEWAERELRLAATLWRFWQRRGYWSEGRRRLDSALTHTESLGDTLPRAEAFQGAGMLALAQGDWEAARNFIGSSLAIGEMRDDDGLRASALHSLGQISWNRRDYSAARALFGRALAIYRRLNARAKMASALNFLGVVASDENDAEAARNYFEEGLAIGRELGDDSLIASSLHSLAHQAFYQDDFVTAREFYGEELRLARRMGDRELTARALHRLGCVEDGLHNHEAARKLFEESFALASSLAYRDLAAAALYNLGATACAVGDYGAAREWFGQRLTLSEELGDRPGLSYALGAFGALLAAQNRYEQAVMLFAAARNLRETLDAPFFVNRSELPLLETARTELGEQAFDHAWQEGRSLTLEQALVLARQPEDTPSP